MSDASSAKRNLPSWMTSDEKGGKSRRKKQDDDDDDNSQFPTLLDGVVFVLSGFVNPERSTLRSQALEMGAEYRPDWSPDCTMLVCAVPNTPKFRQVEADCGTIVSREWISECYSQKKLVDIELFLMHAGKPWRKTINQIESKEGQKDASHEEPRKRHGRKSPEKLTGSAVSKKRKVKMRREGKREKMRKKRENQFLTCSKSSPHPSPFNLLEPTFAEGCSTVEGSRLSTIRENCFVPLSFRRFDMVREGCQLCPSNDRSKRGSSNADKDHFSPSKIKEWAIDDLNKTVSWLESQEEKPEASEVMSIAAQGIITCLQDAIESLKENRDMRLVMEQWMFVPQVVKELVELEPGRSKKGSLSKEELCELAITCKKAYESEYDKLDSSPRRKGKQKAVGDEEDNGNDSDRTIEMTEEEIEIACKLLNS